jgi:hypothetical protein
MITLNISQQYGKIAINTQNASSNLTTTPPKLNIETEPTKVEISQPKGILEIDGTPFRASYGIKTQTQFTQDFAAMSRQAASEGISRICSEGERMANIGTGENVIPNIAADNLMEEVPEVTLVPLIPPDIRYYAQAPQINWTIGTLSITAVRGTLQSNYQPAQVNISMAQYPSIKMWTTGSQVSALA